jgi:hypothetical protein
MATNQQARIVRGYGIYERLKEHKPARLLVFDAEGTEIKVNVPDIRQKHARVMEALKEIAWTRIDLLDKQGGLLYRHHRNGDDRDHPAGEIEELSPSRSVAELSALVSIMLRAQEMVLIRHQAATQGALDTQNRVQEAMLRRFELQDRQYQEAMQLNHQLAANLVRAQLQLVGAANAEDGDNPQSDRAVSALLPSLLRAAFEKDAPAKGKKGKAKPDEGKEPEG